MIEAIGEIVRNVCILVILAAFLELLLPSGQLNGFVRLVMGLLILAAILNPILGFVGQKPALDIYRHEDYSQQTEQLLEEGNELSQGLRQQAQAEYEAGLKGQIASLTALTPGIIEAEVDLQLSPGQGSHIMIERVRILALKDDSMPDEPALRQKIIATIANFYGIDQSLIQVTFSEGGKKNDG
jgi:stage III sporulation protein AF